MTSDRARAFLTGDEGFDAEFKVKLGGLEQEDLVAFANSENGGAILIGVEEYTDSEGRQKGRVVGCAVDDNAKLQVLNRTEQCLPPIEVEIHTESGDERDFMRVEIASSERKPHCTQQGIYKTRGDGRNNPLEPTRMLSMFLELETEVFVSRFREASRGVSELVLESQRTASEAEDSALEGMEYARLAWENTEQILSSLQSLHDKMDALLSHLDIENPEQIRARSKLEEIKWMVDRMHDDDGEDTET